MYLLSCTRSRRKHYQEHADCGSQGELGLQGDPVLSILHVEILFDTLVVITWNCSFSYNHGIICLVSIIIILIISIIISLISLRP